MESSWIRSAARTMITNQPSKNEQYTKLGHLSIHEFEEAK